MNWPDRSLQLGIVVISKVYLLFRQNNVREGLLARAKITCLTEGSFVRISCSNERAPTQAGTLLQFFLIFFFSLVKGL